MHELRRLVNESNARYQRIGDVWSNLTDDDQENLATEAEAMASENEAA